MILTSGSISSSLTLVHLSKKRFLDTCLIYRAFEEKNGKDMKRCNIYTRPNPGKVQQENPVHNSCSSNESKKSKAGLSYVWYMGDPHKPSLATVAGGEHPKPFEICWVGSYAKIQANLTC